MDPAAAWIVDSKRDKGGSPGYWSQHNTWQQKEQWTSTQTTATYCRIRDPDIALGSSPAWTSSSWPWVASRTASGLGSNNGRSRGSRWNAGFQRLPTPHLSPSLLSASFHSTRTFRSLYYFQSSATYVLIERGHISTAPQTSGRVPGYLAACLGLEDPGWLSCCWPARKKA